MALVRKRVKVIKKVVWVGGRENEGMKAFSFLFLQTFVVIYGQSCSEQQKKLMRNPVSVSTHNQSVARLDDARPGSDTAPNAVHEQ